MVYVHVPVCRRKCLYCDFYSVGEKLANWPAFVDAVLAEADCRKGEWLSVPSAPGLSSQGSPHTLYIGGGTPSLMPEKEFARLAGGLLALCGDVDEFTIEVNPDDVSLAKADLWRGCGVNRVSMGVQSLCDAELKAVGRRHTAVTARNAYDVLRGKFGNISLDLMFGLPLQTIESLRTTLDGFAEMDPEHVSAYSLMYEERTALTRLRDAGRVEEAPEDLSAEMFELVNVVLSYAGYEQYEISNYAKPGRRSLHNSSYWRGCAYAGLGPGAHSYDGVRIRSYNPADLAGYVAAMGCPEPAVEELSDDELREEMIMTRLRTRGGLDLDEFGMRFGEGAKKRIMRDADKFLKAGLVRMTGARLALTHSGVMVSDEIMSALF